ncbi:NADH-quinone oxidoreductase subunit 5 family protein [Salmonirosea aquatica]|uniref:NADH-quinone oxidoreductase subunit L n=1 Tax=Salmonirosea aquatica TaxID=2654236 RepID=A0A7C9FY81_9BACT|nr:NADH-quinone oxidoreductase subunit L [Cytophagaceae bacterium SJW1-29]
MPSAALPFSILFLLALPLLACTGIGLAGKRFNGPAGWGAATFTLVGLLFSAFYFSPDEIYAFRFDWITLGDIPFQLTFRLDKLGWLMLLLVHFVAFLVQLYSIAYMHHDAARFRYFAFIQLFIFSMLGIVLSGSLLLMYIFWELVGLSSYLLIGFWHHKPLAAWAAKKAFILNRIGDAAFLTGILLLMYQAGTSDFVALPTSLDTIPPNYLTIIGLCLFGGCVGKSAQFPLSDWLPDAMQGPTPVSALIHAATMVAAGIFLLARIAFMLTPTAQLVIALVGTFTMLHGAWKAMHVWDIKRVLAYSTISQLGLMVLAVGVGSWQVAMFHLLTHAFFKAGLFLSAGSVIHALTSSDPYSPFDPQNMRNMGGLRTLMPRTFVCYVVCAAALAGIPLFSGFLSKDAIFVVAFARAAEAGGLWYLFPLLAVLAAGLTAYYMVRQIWLIFMGEKRYTAEVNVQPHESPALMWVPMGLLAAGSLFFWFSPNPLDAFSGWFLGGLQYQPEVHASWVPLLSVIATGVALGLVYRQVRRVEGFFEKTIFEKYSDRHPVWQQTYGRFRTLAAHDETTQHRTFFLIAFQKIAIFCAQLDREVLDAVVNGLGRLTVVLAHLIAWTDRHITDGGVKVVVGATRGAGQVVRLFQNGKIQSYFLLTFVSMLLLLLWVMLL